MIHTKIAINKCYGNFNLSQTVQRELGISSAYAYSSEKLRTDKKLIEALEKAGEWKGGPYSKIVIVEIPDEITDYKIISYDGMETVLYVIDGKIHQI